jgi:hypothetical protein
LRWEFGWRIDQSKRGEPPYNHLEMQPSNLKMKKKTKEQPRRSKEHNNASLGGEDDVDKEPTPDPITCAKIPKLM